MIQHPHCCNSLHIITDSATHSCMFILHFVNFCTIVLVCPSVTFTTHSTYITYSIHLETEAVFSFFSIFGGLFFAWIRLISWWRPLSRAFDARVQLLRLFRCARLVQSSRVFGSIPQWSRAPVLYRESFCGLQFKNKWKIQWKRTFTLNRRNSWYSFALNVTCAVIL